MLKIFSFASFALAAVIGILRPLDQGVDNQPYVLATSSGVTDQRQRANGHGAGQMSGFELCCDKVCDHLPDPPAR